MATVSAILQKTPNYQQNLGTYNKGPGEFGFPGQLPPNIIGMSIPRQLGVYNFPQLPTNLPTSTNGTQGSEMQLPINVIRMLPYLNTIRRWR